MQGIVIDIETTTLVESGEPVVSLDISVVGAYDYSDNTYHTYTTDELNDLWERIQKTNTLIGFNSDHFDIPLLNKYCPFDLKAMTSFDILRELRKIIHRRVSLNAVAQGTLGIAKSGKGVDAVEWWKKGEIERVKKYCNDDVEITKRVFDYLRENNLLKFVDGGILYEKKIPINWNVYEPPLQHKTLF